MADKQHSYGAMRQNQRGDSLESKLNLKQTAVKAKQQAMKSTVDRG